MHRTLATLLAATLVLLAAPAAAQKLYKWVDPQGNVSYHDRPPPAGSGYQVEEKPLRDRRAATATSPSEEAAEKAPVVLYTASKCSSCDAARAHLERRKVPFTEKNVETDPKAQEELKAKVGALTVPTILVGPKVMNGYLESLLDGELDAAGYPKAPPAGSEGETAPATGSGSGER